MKKRCEWCLSGVQLYIDYHDQEWGVPVHDDKVLFEFLIIQGAQAGLSWLTILKRREGYRTAFADFDALKVSKFPNHKIEQLLQNDQIIRNKAKINSAINNARAFLKVQEEFGSFSNYQWQFVNNQPIINHWETDAEIPAATKQAKDFSADLKKRGFTFVGPTIIYAHMQATGMVNDHTTNCFRHSEVQI